MGKTQKQKLKKDSVLNISLNNNLPTLSIDGFMISAKDDGFFLIRFIDSLPECQIEQARIKITKQHAIGLIDMLCKATGYIPKEDNIKERNKK